MPPENDCVYLMTMRMTAQAFTGLLAIGVLASVIVYLHRDNAKLQTQVIALRGRDAPLTRMVEENQRAREFLAREKTDANEAARALHQDVVRLRSEVRELEEYARAAAAQKAAATAALAANLDPEMGLALLENFHNVGRGTPGAAVQTLIWAVLQAEERALVASLALASDAREEALQLLAHLPDSARATYPTPENLAALMVTNEILRVDAVQIVDTTPVDAQHVIVNVRLAGTDGTEKIPTELGADGWKVTVPKKMILGLEKRLNPSAPPAPKK